MNTTRLLVSLRQVEQPSPHRPIEGCHSCRFTISLRRRSFEFFGTRSSGTAVLAGLMQLLTTSFRCSELLIAPRRRLLLIATRPTASPAILPSKSTPGPGPASDGALFCRPRRNGEICYLVSRDRHVLVLQKTRREASRHARRVMITKCSYKGAITNPYLQSAIAWKSASPTH